MRPIKNLFEQFLNGALLVVCGLLIWFFIVHRQLFLHRPSSTSTNQVLTGATLQDVPGYEWKDHTATLVLGLQEGCHFCQESIPFYKKLSDAEHAGNAHAHLLAIMPNPSASATSYLRSNALNTEGSFGHPLSDMGISFTPTLMLVNSSGKVLHAWVGQLNQAQEMEVMAAIR